jgi:hypothetical protein
MTSKRIAAVRVMGRSKAVNIGHVEKKLRQAEFFLAQLQDESREVAMQLRKARAGVDMEPSEFYFSACLGAAKSAYEKLHKIQDPMLKERLQLAKKALPHDPSVVPLEKMGELRDDDVHHGGIDATALPKLAEDNSMRDAPEDFFAHNPNLFGQAPVTEHENPDGTRVAATALLGSMGLYLDHEGRHIEATTVCRDLIQQLHWLVNKAQTEE